MESHLNFEKFTRSWPAECPAAEKFLPVAEEVSVLGLSRTASCPRAPLAVPVALGTPEQRASRNKGKGGLFREILW